MTAAEPLTAEEERTIREQYHGSLHWMVKQVLATLDAERAARAELDATLMAEREAHMAEMHASESARAEAEANCVEMGKHLEARIATEDEAIRADRAITEDAVAKRIAQWVRNEYGASCETPAAAADAIERGEWRR